MDVWRELWAVGGRYKSARLMIHQTIIAGHWIGYWKGRGDTEWGPGWVAAWDTEWVWVRMNGVLHGALMGYGMCRWMINRNGVGRWIGAWDRGRNGVLGGLLNWVLNKLEHQWSYPANGSMNSVYLFMRLRTENTMYERLQRMIS